jgi:16S rRNA (uracil1498-N3)-methyltransferase
VERDDLASLAGFLASGDPLVPGATVRLGEEAAHHARVRRLEVGSRVYLTDGAGTQATGTITRLAKREADVRVDQAARFERSSDVHLIVPIADRDRMLWLAEKSTELGAASWRPVLWHRSRSVSPRGEGPAFASRVNGRMASALIQSHSPWLPEIHPDSMLSSILSSLPSGGTRLMLDVAGKPVARTPVVAPVVIAVGPEGGLEPDERDQLGGAGFRPVSLGANVLRFETAAIAALAIVRCALAGPPETIDG